MTQPADTTADLPSLALTSDAWATLDAGLAREWLVSNGLGGYAMGTVVGATTRCYHAYLVAAPRSPQERVALVTKIDEQVTLANGDQIALGADEYAGGVVQPQGYQRLSGFALEGLIPTFRFDLGGGLTLEKRVWMEHGANLTFAQYRLIATPDAPTAPITLRLHAIPRQPRPPRQPAGESRTGISRSRAGQPAPSSARRPPPTPAA